MKNSLACSLMLGLGVVMIISCGKKKDPDNNLFGTWKAAEKTFNVAGSDVKGKTDEQWKIEQGKVTHIVKCSFRNESITVQASSNAKIDNSKIEIQQETKQEKDLILPNRSKQACKAHLEKLTHEYKIETNKLTLSAGNNKITLTKVR